MVDATGMRLVCFELRGQELALPIDDVRETLPIQPITRVVLTPPALAGVFSLRGDIVPVIDLATLLGMTRSEASDDSRIVVLKHARGAAAIVVDRLRDLRTVTVKDGKLELEPPPSHLSPAIANLLAGIVATPTGTVRVLDANEIVCAEPLRPLADGPSTDTEAQP